MNSTLKVVLIIAGIFLGLSAFVGLTCFTSYVEANNYGSRTESQLKAERDNNKNILAQYSQKIQEAAQVPDMYKNDFKEIVNASMQGRYGEGGSKATFQWIKEHDIKVEPALYTKLQNMIEGGRKDFEYGQTRMIDVRKGYEAQLGYFWRGMWLRFAGYPKINLADYQPIVTDRVESVYKDGKESSPLKLK